MPIELTQHSTGLILKVKVVPGSSRDRIAGEYDNGIKVTVRKAPQAGQANRAVIELLAAALQIPQANLQIIRGPASPRKQVLISGLSAELIRQRLAAEFSS